MRTTLICLAILLAAWTTVPLLAQQPAKPPALPPISPAQARLDQTLGGLDGPGFGVAYNEQAGLLAVGCDQGSIHYWPKEVILGIRAGERTPHVLHGHTGPVLAVASAGGPVLASGGADHKVVLWELPDGKVLHTLDAGAPVRALAMSPDGKTVAAGGDGPAIRLWDVATGKSAASDGLRAHTDWLLGLAFSPDGKQLAASGYDGIVRVWEVGTGKKLLEVPGKPPPPPKTPPGPPNIVWSVAFSPDGKQVAVGGADEQIHILNTADGKVLRSLAGHGSAITGLVFHPSGTLLVSTSKDRTVRLWNPANGQALKSLEGHTAWVQGVTFLANGTRLATVGADQTVRLWELR